MPFDLSDEEDVLDLEEEFRDVQLPDQNMYIADSQHAAELLALLIHNESPKETRAVKKIRLHIDQLFGLFSNIRLDNELQLYQEFMQLCSKLSKRQKIRKIRDKVVISFGGKFSAGKSQFINSISGIDGLLPVKQQPTTSIPTYIIGAEKDGLQANSIYGYSVTLTKDTMDALTHEFDEQYHIGFAPFIDNAIASSVRSNDVLSEFRRLVKELRCSIQAEIKRAKDIEKMLFKYIEDSDKIMQIRSLTEIWGHTNQEQYQMTNLKHRFEDAVDAIQREIKRYIESE